MLNVQDEGDFTPLAAALGGSQDPDAQAQAQEVIPCPRVSVPFVHAYTFCSDFASSSCWQ